MISGTSLVFFGLTVVYCFIMKEPLGIFGLNVYMLTIGVGTGRWAKELTLPYVYLIPEKSWKKLFHILREQIPSLVVESVVCFLPVCFILKLNIAEVFAMILARISFGFLFIGINLILQRFAGSKNKKFIVITVYFLLIALFSAPSVAAAFIMNMYMPFYMAFTYLAMAVVNVPLSLIILLCCRNILEYADYNNK